MKTLLLSLFVVLSSQVIGLGDIKNTIECSYATNDADPNIAQLQPRGKCAYKQGDQIFISDATLRKLSFSAKGIASVFAKSYGWLFVKQDGATITAVTFDNGPDTFSESLARYTHGGRIGFVDESGNVVVDAKFEFAFPFHDGHAIVCEGCTKVLDGEHSGLHGGRWGCIDKKGRIIFRIQYSEEELASKLGALNNKSAR